jgi:starvation-inducible DNA-binding protein
MLAEDNASLAARASDLADEAGDADDLATHDMLVKRIEVHEKAAWLLRSHLG